MKIVKLILSVRERSGFSSFPLIHSRRVAKVCAQITGKPLVQACPGKSVVRLTDRPTMTIAVDLGRKATKPTNLSVVECLTAQDRGVAGSSLTGGSALCP